MLSRFQRVSTTATALHVSKATVRRMIADGTLACWQLRGKGSCVLVDWASFPPLKELMESETEQETA